MHPVSEILTQGRKLGRPTTYNLAQATKIISGLSEGKTLKACLSLPAMPSKSVVFRWIRLFPEFKAQFFAATELRTESLAEDLLDIADDSESEVNDRALRIKTRQWLMERLNPRYSPRNIMEGNPERPITVEIAAFAVPAAAPVLAREFNASINRPARAELLDYDEATSDDGKE